jgi:hypothetical protein
MLEAFVKLELPMPDAALASPLLIAGQAVGNWFFEGTFPVRLIDQDGQELATGYVTAAEPWMTTEFVPFEGALKFSVLEATQATLILERDNPSGLALHDASVHVPLTLLPGEDTGTARQAEPGQLERSLEYKANSSASPSSGAARAASTERPLASIAGVGR